MQLIINADDLGYSPVVNEAIFDLIRRRLITSSTFLANSLALDQALEHARSLKHCSFGVHLNLTELRPLTDSPGLRPILIDDGAFNANRIREVHITPALRAAVFHEWSAQVQRIIDSGIVPSHLDSHHHSHTTPGLFPVLKRLQRRFGIRRVRISMNIYPRSKPASKSLLARKFLWNAALRSYYSTKTTDAFTDFETFLDLATARRLPYRKVELMVHPGNPGFQRETEMLELPWVQSLPGDTRLISYNDL